MTAFQLKGDIRAQDPGVRLYFGAPGSGKSYLLRHDVIDAARHRVIVVIDATREWADDDGALTATLPAGIDVRGAKTVAKVLDRIEAMETGIIVYHPRVWIEDTTALAGVIAVRGGSDKPIGIAVSEAHNLMPNGKPLTAGFDAIVTRWRHLQIAAFFDTQRPAQLARTVTELATVTHLFAVRGPRDIEAFSELVDDPIALMESSAEARRRFAAGQSGWHTRHGLDLAPPYPLVRR